MLNPDRPMHLRAIVRELKEEINAVRRELLRLEKSKIITSETHGNKKVFLTNLQHPFFSVISAMFHKTYGLGGAILNKLGDLGDIEFVFLTPAYTKGFYFGTQVIDLVIVGVVDLKSLQLIIDEIQTEEGREIHYTILKPSEFELRKRRQDLFLKDLLIQDIVMIVGSRESLIR